MKSLHLIRFSITFYAYLGSQACISGMEIDGPTFVPKRGPFLLIWAKVCLKRWLFLNFGPILRAGSF